tara:strand:- start:1657 stop:2973 length:1317 start_codon:yes stop_codon:yes gene_type:complete
MFNFINYLDQKNINNYLLLALSFFITISIYITDVIILLLILSWIIGGSFKYKLERIFSSPLMTSVICFLLYFLVAYLWSDSIIWNPITKKQLLIILLPILYTLNFNNSYINRSKYAFILGLIINIVLSIITIYIPANPLFKTGHYDSSLFLHGFLDHFDYSIFLCFGILLLFSYLNKTNLLKSLILIIIFLCALLNSYGRIGILSFFIFFPIMIIVSKKDAKSYYILTFIILFGLISYQLFSPLNNRVNETLHNIKLLSSKQSLEEKIENDAIYLASQNDSLSKKHFIKKIKNNPTWIDAINNKQPKYETSIGKRYLYAKNSILLIKQKPVFGYGPNQFQKVYKDYFSTNHSVNHPHNNFIFILTELGLVGLIFVLYIFYCQIKHFFRSNKKRTLELIFPIFFLFIMLFDNYFINHNTLVFFCLFSFLIYSDKIVSVD